MSLEEYNSTNFFSKARIHVLLFVATLDPVRKALGVILFILFLVSFTPVPLKFS